ncbi:uncharacterized protein aPKC isoform X2 [Planococcus citri]
MYLLSIIFAISHLVVVIYSDDRPVPHAICIKKNVDISTVENVIYPYSESFLDMIIKSSAWVDKTLLLQTIAESRKKYDTITCARRWGKSINLSMIKLFLEIPTNEYDFQKGETLQLIPRNESRAYWFFREGIIYNPRNQEKVLLEDKPLIANFSSLDKHMQQYPVILLNFKGMYGWKGCMSVFKEQTANVFKSHRYLLDGWYSDLEDSALCASQKSKMHCNIYRFKKYMQGSEPAIGIHFLIDELKLHHGKEVVVLIDEYNSFYNNLYFSGNRSNEEEAREILGFFASFFIGTFKGNSNVHKLIMTGISRVAGVATFSQMESGFEVTNFINMGKLSPYYGINLDEFRSLASKRMIDDKVIQNAINRYDGYSVLNKPGLKHISAWSLMNFVNKHFVGNFWEETSAPSSIFKLLKYPDFMEYTRKLLDDIPIKISYCYIALLPSKYGERLNDLIHTKVEKNLHDISLYTNIAAFALLVQAGYLTPVDHHEDISKNIDTEDRTKISLKIPNNEIKDAIQSYVINMNTGLLETYARLFCTLSQKCAESLEILLSNFGDMTQRTTNAEDFENSVLKLFAANGPYTTFNSDVNGTAFEFRDKKMYAYDNEEAIAGVLLVVAKYLRGHDFAMGLNHNYLIYPNDKKVDLLPKKPDLFLSSDAYDIDAIIEFRSDNSIPIERVLLQAIQCTGRYRTYPMKHSTLVYIAIGKHEDHVIKLKIANKTRDEVDFLLAVLEEQVNSSDSVDTLVKSFYKNAIISRYMNALMDHPLCSELTEMHLPQELIVIFNAYNVDNVDTLKQLKENDFTEILRLPNEVIATLHTYLHKNIQQS